MFVKHWARFRTMYHRRKDTKMWGFNNKLMTERESLRFNYLQKEPKRFRREFLNYMSRKFTKRGELKLLKRY